MRRAWKHSVIAFSLAVLAPSPALAFHVGSDFDKSPGAGGGGGLFYTGAPAERGFTCAACHTSAPGKIRISLSESSGTLLSTLRYTPGAAYPLTATMTGDSTSIQHFNSLAVSIVDDAGKPVGSIGGFSADDFYQSATGTIASAGKTPNVTSWTFTWTAPPSDAGPVHLHVASVAGNAAGLPGLTLSDPFGDDVFAGTLDLAPDGRTSSREDGEAPLFAGLGVSALLLRAKRKNGGRR